MNTTPAQHLFTKRTGRSAALHLIASSLLAIALSAMIVVPAQGQNIDTLGTRTLDITVNKIHWTLSPALGDGGMSSQFSWNTVLRKEATEPFYYPADRFQSNMLFQLFNVVNFSDEGYIDMNGERRERMWRIMGGDTEWSMERRRWRPPTITVDGLLLTPPYQWEGNVDPTLPSDYHAVFEEVYRDPATGYGGFRNRIELFAFSNPNHQDYVIWKETRKYTGETALLREIRNAPEREVYLPNQTVRVWWAYTMGFGPTKGGERESWGFYAFEGEDDKEHFFQQASEIPGTARDELVVAYFWDDMTDQSPPYQITLPDGTTVSNDDDAGDPNRINGGLTATMIPGFTILYADQSAQNHVDDPNQPMAAPRGNINSNFFGQQGNFLQRDVYAGLANPWPAPAPRAEKGSMRALTVGPYDLTVERDANGNLVRADSFTVVYAIGVGDVGYEVADSLGKAWLRGEISNAEKRAFIEMGRDSLFRNLDRANWAWANDLRVPAPPPPPDIAVSSGPEFNLVEWSYPETRYFEDPHTGVNDFAKWRIYRKEGGYWVNDPDDDFQGHRWELVHEIEAPGTTQLEWSWEDTNVERGVPYYYAVTAVDDGSQNTFGLFPGQALESPRYANQTQLPVAAFKAGLDVSNQVRVVPNPATSAAGALAFTGAPNQILFVNLPFEATLSIYTESGELVTRMDHYGSADESWDQRTDGNQYVASGIYVLAVHNARDSEGNSLPDQFVKFIIVR